MKWCLRKGRRVQSTSVHGGLIKVCYPNNDEEADIADIWAGALVNGTLYIYGGQAKMSAGQSSNTWSKLPSFQNK